ncbi:hypothetical protein [Enhydrobacter sp.]|jgi:hypothetical protein|uniref:hypothetical protein n=1 Tax=Enhydrobacter sp. TaxID=1894999 RepID=UPI002616C933|nr:hypothetical protein [Enhydrobacter sp.]WIM14105.1 MAG: hypothetical protein OJF58_005075 [Enhydrobacter sp.]
MRVYAARKLASSGAILAFLGALAGNAASAADDDRLAGPAEIAQLEQKIPADPEPWRFTVTPYAWLMGVSGNVTARGQTIDTNASFIDLVQKSDSLVGLMAYFEANKGKAGIYTDFVFSRLGFSAGQTSYRNPIGGLKITTTANAALTYQMFIVEVGGVYEVHRWPGSEGSFTAVDALGGFRYWNNSIDASFDVTSNVDFSRLHLERSFGLAIARSDAIQWVDPVIGFRVRHQFTPHQELWARADIGGFGLAGSRFSWQAVAAYTYLWQASGYQVGATIGFRALGVNYGSGGGPDAVGINETLYGPIIGASFRF